MGGRGSKSRFANVAKNEDMSETFGTPAGISLPTFASMYKDGRYIPAGQNEIYRYGKKAQAKATAYLEPNDAGFYSIPADGGKYWTIGTTPGKYGDYAIFGNSYLSVNKAGYVWAKVGTAKESAFIEMVQSMIKKMKQMNAERLID